MNYPQKVLPIIREARNLLLPYYGKAEVIANKGKFANNIVTELDIKAEDFISSRLKAIDDSIGFVGEENGGDRKAKKFWLLDPIDGTAHFVRGLPFCTTMLALVENREVIFSAIYNFVNDKMYWAEKGKGAFEEDNPIKVSTRSLAQSYLCWEMQLEKEENRESYYKLREKARLFKTISAGYEYILVATGKLEGRVNYNPYGKDYDYAPGALLVSEAGGIVKNIGSDSYNYTNLNFIAANPLVYKELTEGKEAIFRAN